VTLTYALVVALRKKAMAYDGRDGDPEMKHLLQSAAIAIECLAGFAKEVPTAPEQKKAVK
jgi:hypothetical protein